jgi:hypothetical protein
MCTYEAGTTKFSGDAGTRDVFESEKWQVTGRSALDRCVATCLGFRERERLANYYGHPFPF